jgi:hypothetical protein
VEWGGACEGPASSSVFDSTSSNSSVGGGSGGGGSSRPAANRSQQGRRAVPSLCVLTLTPSMDTSSPGNRLSSASESNVRLP